MVCTSYRLFRDFVLTSFQKINIHIPHPTRGLRQAESLHTNFCKIFEALSGEEVFFSHLLSIFYMCWHYSQQIKDLKQPFSTLAFDSIENTLPKLMYYSYNYNRGRSPRWQGNGWIALARGCCHLATLQDAGSKSAPRQLFLQLVARQ